MKNKSFERFTKRNTHKRKSKDAARAELLRAAGECGVGTDGLHIKDTYDGGKRARSSYLPHRDETVAEGVFCGSRSGFGFVKLEKEDIFIPEDKCLGAIDGDLVEIVFHRFENRFGEQKTEGRVRKIVEYGRRFVTGEVEEVYQRHGRRTFRAQVLISDSGRIYPNPYIVGGKVCKVGDKVSARLIRRGGYIECEVTENFGPAYTREANYKAILSECEIETEFTDEQLQCAAEVANEPMSDDGRVRLDEEIIFTMDGEGAKDLDDAVSLTKTDDGYRLGVHIADVSHYVRERTALDRCAMARGTSVYFTDKVVPMLPETLSNGACSLNSGEDKYAISAFIDLSADGEILHLELLRTTIRSRVRGVYSEVNRLLDGTADEKIREKYSEVKETLTLMRELYSVLEKRHRARGAIDFDGEEAVIVLDDKGEPCEIIPRERGVAERVIEQFMLCANEAVATELHKKEIPCVYRVHEPPPKDKFDAFVTFAHNLGFDTSYIRRDTPDSASLQKLLSEAERRGLSEPISYSMLRTMSKAKYSEVREGHFGLGIKNYCHFTSPIRRLSDLATHRIINNVLIDGKPAKQYASYAKRAAAAATEGELRAITAERRIEDLYKCVYMSRFIGETFDGRISSVTSFGLFVKLANTCEGLVPISDMDGEYRFDEKNVTLVSKTGVYRLGEAVRVNLVECDISLGKIRFEIARGEK